MAGEWILFKLALEKDREKPFYFTVFRKLKGEESLYKRRRTKAQMQMQVGCVGARLLAGAGGRSVPSMRSENNLAL